MKICDLGIISYEEALRVQHDILSRRIGGTAPDTLILAEHPPVVTLGRLSDDKSVPGRLFFESAGIPVLRVGRGGKTTFHLPGQLLMYPVLDLGALKRDVSSYIDFLEITVERSLNRLGVPAAREAGQRGVWVADEKIAFTGIALKHWVTYHGVAVNINNDTSGFRFIHPCGESGIKVTSAKDALGRELDMAEVKKVFAAGFEADLATAYHVEERLAVPA